MKNLIVILALITGTSYANAQKIKPDDVPAKVKEAFAKKYPDIKAEKWEKEDANYEAEFELIKVETSVLFDIDGNFKELEQEIKISDLPKSVTDYINKNLPNKKIKEAAQISSADGTITYEAEVNKTDYLFDSKGNFLKSSK